LEKRHDRAAFSCGEPSLDDWFQRRAGQDERRNVARVYVAVDSELGVVGFYSLSSFSIDIEDLPEDVARKLPRYDAVPAALIGRLARDLRVAKRRVGGLLLADAINRIISAGRSLAVFTIVVDSLNEAATSFYRHFGFTPFPKRPNRLFLLTSVAAAALEEDAT
jgi:ribosomal protein S18 acetylase RimI-like enzyme